MGRLWRVIAVCLLFVPDARAAGQLPTPLPSDCDAIIDLLATTSAAADRTRLARQLVAMNLHPGCLAESFVASEKQVADFPAFIRALERVRTDKQAGASAGAGGSTNLISKGSTAKVLSIAAEYGALTESVNKQIVTVQGSLDGVPAALVRHNLFAYCPSSSAPGCVSNTLVELLRRFSYAVAFDTSRSAQIVSGTPSGAASGAAQPVTFTADEHSITGTTVRIVLLNQRDQVSKVYQDAWVKQVTKSHADLDNAASSLLKSTVTLVNTVEADPSYQPWQEETVRQLTAAPAVRDDVLSIWAERQHVLAEALRTSHPDIFDKAAQQRETLSAYRFEEDAVVATLQKPVATLQYDYRRPANQPTTSTLRLIFDKGLGGGWSFAANAAVEFYNEQPTAQIPGVTTVRDSQVGAQFQRDLGTFDVLGAAALAATYYFQYQNSPSILNIKPGAPLDGISLVGVSSAATQVFATKGNIHVVQLRLVLGAGTGARFPISVTHSNRTELIDHPTWRGQIGFSYDFDSLFTK